MKAYNADFRAWSKWDNEGAMNRKVQCAGSNEADAAKGLEANFAQITGLKLVEIEKKEEEEKK